MMIKGHIINYLILLTYIIAQTLSNPVQKPNHHGLTCIINIVINRPFHNIVENKFKSRYPGTKTFGNLIFSFTLKQAAPASQTGHR